MPSLRPSRRSAPPVRGARKAYGYLKAGTALARTRARRRPARNRRRPLLAALVGSGTAVLAVVNRNRLTRLVRRGGAPEPDGGGLAQAGAGPAVMTGGVAGAAAAPEPTGAPTDAAAPAPAPSNYDAPGPPANTATPVPAPEGSDPGSIDAEDEVAAAAAEAGAIGGPVSPSASSLEDPGTAADEPERPLAEAGQGVSEGQEQAEGLLAEHAGPPASAESSDAQKQIDEAIEATGQPGRGERVERADDVDRSEWPKHEVLTDDRTRPDEA